MGFQDPSAACTFTGSWYWRVVNVPSAFAKVTEEAVAASGSSRLVAGSKPAVGVRGGVGASASGTSRTMVLGASAWTGCCGPACTPPSSAGSWPGAVPGCRSPDASAEVAAASAS